MKCPYCNIDMEVGLIQSQQELTWIKGTKRKFATASFLHKESIVLSQSSLVRQLFRLYVEIVRK